MSNTFTQQALMGLLAPLADNVTSTSGLLGAGGVVTQTASPSMAVKVTPAIWVVPGPAPTSQGAFLWTAGTSDQTVAVGAADATNPRIDILVVQVNDPGNTTTPGDASYAIVAGTPGASPASPPTPTGAVFVRNVRVNVGDTTVTNARISGAPTVASVRQPVTAVQAPTKTNPKLYYGTITQTTDSSGYLTWTHGIGSTPAVIGLEVQSPLTGLGNVPVYPLGHITDSYGSSTARTRFWGGASTSGGPVGVDTTSVTFRWWAFA